MKRILGFGFFSNDIICKGIFITSFLILLRIIYFNSFGISINDTNAEKLIFYSLNFYVRFLEPIVLLIWLKFVCEFLYKCLKRN
jgi:hypothetical protein